jgi:hypothetical protein
MIDQSEILSHSQVQFITLVFGGAQLCCDFYETRQATRIWWPISWAKSTHFDFFTINVTVWSHILSSDGDALSSCTFFVSLTQLVMCHDCLPSRPVLGGYLIMVITFSQFFKILQNHRTTYWFWSFEKRRQKSKNRQHFKTPEELQFSWNNRLNAVIWFDIFWNWG